MMAGGGVVCGAHRTAGDGKDGQGETTLYSTLDGCRKSTLASSPMNEHALKEENRRLRQALSDVVAGLRNGGAASPDASLDFLCDGVPREVALSTEYWRMLARRVLKAPGVRLPMGEPLAAALAEQARAVDTTHAPCADCGRMVPNGKVCEHGGGM